VVSVVVGATPFTAARAGIGIGFSVPEMLTAPAQSGPSPSATRTCLDPRRQGIGTSASGLGAASQPALHQLPELVPPSCQTRPSVYGGSSATADGRGMAAGSQPVKE